MNLFMLLGSVSARKCGSDAGTGAGAVVVLWMLLVTMTFTTTASGPAWANERSRMFQDCMAFQMIAVEASTVDGDPNDAMSLATRMLEENGALAALPAMAANIDNQFQIAQSTNNTLGFRLWLKWIADGIADEPIQEYRLTARATAGSFEACILHVYDINLGLMAGWQDTE